MDCLLTDYIQKPWIYALLVFMALIKTIVSCEVLLSAILKKLKTQKASIVLQYYLDEKNWRSV